VSEIRSQRGDGSDSVPTVVVRTARWAALGSVVAAVATRYLLDSAVARGSSLAFFGDYALMMTLGLLLGSIAPLGLPEVGNRYVADLIRAGEAQQVRWYLALTSGLAVLLGLVLAGAVALLQPLIGLEAPGLGLSLALVVPSVGLLLARRGQALQLGGGNAVLFAPGLSTGLSVLLLIALLVSGVTVTLPWAGACVAVGNVLIAFGVCRPRIPGASSGRLGSLPSAVRGWIRSGLQAVSNAVASLVLTQGDIIVIGLLALDSSAGAYAAASRLALVVTLALGGLIPREAPILGRLVAEGDPGGAWKQYRQASMLSGAMGTALCLGLWLLGEPILEAFVPGSGVAAGWLAVLAVGRLVSSFVGPGAELLIAFGQQRLAARCSWLGAVVAVALMFALFPVWGPMGVAVGATLGMLVRSSGHFLAARHVTNREIQLVETER
jgi:O-antigen/teichoic acid export membrane protein